MKIIVGLWNPGKQYENTRHNVWFMFVNWLFEKYSFSDFIYESKFKADISEWNFLDEKTILLKPQTFMNLSWESIKKIVNFYKVDIKDWIVVFDDISMDFWKLRFRDKWSAWGHNWLKDIIRYFNQDFNRIKLWVWFNDKYEVSDWVLSKFTMEELIDLDNNVFLECYNLLKEKI